MPTVVSRLEFLEKHLIILIFLIMTLSSIFQVINRNILHFPIGWTEEVARYCQVWLILLATEVGLRRGQQMAINIMVTRLKGAAFKLVQMVSSLTILAFCLIVVWYALELMMVQIENRQVSSALRMPMTIPYAAMPFCFVVMSFSQLFQIVRLFSAKTGAASNDDGQPTEEF
ncbi:MAG: TRAP transporter small permease [Methylobacteriaceae bacterium]|jgi:TRAP-type C4-dicarboxylate transport system permease small subunit|nr:TRAP transporter small permease [Methylobacteriaceae bacterium]